MTRHILICTIGQTPQVVTETVWALKNPSTARQADSPRISWLPDEIHIVTTSVGYPRVRDALQNPKGHLAPFFPGPPPVTIHVPCRSGKADTYDSLPSLGDWGDAAQKPGAIYAGSAEALADVNSEHDTATMGDLILQIIARFVREDDTEIHVSLAGGRKTMSAHALLALTLLGRPQDGASHVLVSPLEFEDNPEFWHPDQAGGLIRRKLRPGEDRAAVSPSLDPKTALVTLVPTPTPLMRYEVKSAAIDALRLVDLVAELNLAAELSRNPQVRLITGANTICVGDVERKLNPKSFAVYRLIATAWREQWPGVGPLGDGGKGWLSAPLLCVGTTPDGRRIEEVLLQYLRDAVQVAGGDPQENRSVDQWRLNVVDETNSAMKLANANSAIGSNTRLTQELKDEFGSAVAAVIAPRMVEGHQEKLQKGEPIKTAGATRFGIGSEFAPAAVVIA